MVVVRKPLTAPQLNAMKTHCKHGHEFTKENTIWRINPNHGGKMRGCRQCKLARATARRRKQGRPERLIGRKLIYWKLEDLRRLVDIVWQHATESASVPSTKTADMLIDRAASSLSSPDKSGAA